MFPEAKLSPSLEAYMGLVHSGPCSNQYFCMSNIILTSVIATCLINTRYFKLILNLISDCGKVYWITLIPLLRQNGLISRLMGGLKLCKTANVFVS